MKIKKLLRFNKCVKKWPKNAKNPVKTLNVKKKKKNTKTQIINLNSMMKELHFVLKNYILEIIGKKCKIIIYYPSPNYNIREWDYPIK